MSQLARILFPWPWKLKESPDYRRPTFTVVAANNAVVGIYGGQDGRAQAESIMELAAQKSINERKTK